MKVIMYTTHCPQCNVLAKKLEQKKITYTEVDDIEAMQKLNIKSAPMLSVEDSAPMNFKEAITWINSVEA